MEMEDHHHHHHHHHHNNHQQQQQQQQQYGITDLRQLVNGVAAARSTHHFPASSIPPAAHPTAELFPGHPNLTAPTQQHHYEMMMFGRQVADIMPPRCLHEFASTDAAAAAPTTTNTSIAVATTPTTTTSASTPPLSGLGGDASTGRWPRQETLTLLEIRSRLDLKFKEANQKGPLWDEVSRIMSEEHGYQRSGKKCREKFENLYKYYKKTKEGKAGRQDGKHYRFFRQLEALYGENSSNTASAPDTTSIRYHQTTTTNQDMLLIHHHHKQHCDSLSLTNSTDLDTSSSDDNDDEHVNHSHDDDNQQGGGGGLNNNGSVEKIIRRKQRGGSGRSWKVKIKDFIDLQMRKLVEKQEEWLDKLMKTLEQKEKERALREEEWRRQEAARLEKEHKFWAKERSWIEARDAALMDALQKLTGGSDQAKVMMMMNNESPDEGIVAAAGIQSQNNNNNEDGSSESWPEPEIARLLQLRAEMVETRSFRQGGGCSEEAMWEEVASKMACFGYERSALMLKDKWESISSYHHQNPRSSSNNNIIGAHKEGNKKRKDNNSRTCFYFDGNEQLQPSLYNQGSGGGGHGDGGGFCDINDQRQQQQTNDGSSPSNSNVGNAADTCFPFLMTEGGTLWDNYSLKLDKANQNQ